MCVIIFVPEGKDISVNELKEAWTTNPDGAGYAIQKDGIVKFKRGFMHFEEFLKEIVPLIGKYNLLLHFRISTSKKVNKIQTHPYKKGNVTITQGETTKPVICMNGIISKQKEYKECNDTMSYIIDHEDAFANINQDILNIIEDATGAKWAVMKPNEVLLSSEFIEHEGRFYSNKNHLYMYSYYYKYNYNRNNKKAKTFKSMIKPQKLRKEIVKDWPLYNDVCDYIEFNCNYDDQCDCSKCLQKCKTKDEIIMMLYENWYYTPEYCTEEEIKNNLCQLTK